ncbi:MAG: hypothetical protein ACHQ53_02235 [Polyangiales bacterium]
MYERCTRLTAATVLLAWIALGCHRDGDKAAAGASAADEVGRPLADMELPVSLRNSDVAPTNERKIEATTEQLRIDGTPVIALDKGKVADADKSDGTIPKLSAQLASPMKSTIALRLAANVPYETMALVLNTAKKAGINNAAFQVRATGITSKPGWLVADGFVMSSKADDLPPIQGVKQRTWDDFTAKWQEVHDACRTAVTGNCAYVDATFAKGGTLKIELMASGRGINIDFYRRGLTPAQEQAEEKAWAAQLAAKKEDFLQGRISRDDMVDILVKGDPSTQALFQFRYEEALKGPSALSRTMAPMCHTERCGVVMTADSISPVVRIVNIIGGAFPDGSMMPSLAFEMPWTKKPKPLVTPTWAPDVTSAL